MSMLKLFLLMLFVIGGLLAVMYFTSCGSIIQYFKARNNPERNELDKLKESEFAHSTQALVLKHVTHRQLHQASFLEPIHNCLCSDKYEAHEEEDVKGLPWYHDVKINLRTEWALGSILWNTQGDPFLASMRGVVLVTETVFDFAISLLFFKAEDSCACTCNVENQLVHNITTLCDGAVLEVVDEFKTVYVNTCVNQCTVVESDENGGAIFVAILTSIITKPVLIALEYGFNYLRGPAEEALEASLGLAWAREAHEKQQNQPINKLKRFILGKEPEPFNEEKETTAKESIKGALGQDLQRQKLYAMIPYFYTVIVSTVCCFFIALVSLQIGRARSELWLTTAIMAFLIGEFINNPVKLVRNHSIPS